MLTSLAAYPLPLPSPLPLQPMPAGSTPQRRYHAGPIDLRGEPWSAFMRAAEDLLRAPLGLNPDHLASGARWLLVNHPHRQHAACIRARLHIIAVLHALRAEPYWQLPPASAALVQRLLERYDGPEHVIPARLPVLGHLDDAILLDAIWPRISEDVSEYMDFRRLRRIEAEGRGVAPSRLPYTREDWLVSRELEHRLLHDHFRRATPGRYTGSIRETPRFQVH